MTNLNPRLIKLNELLYHLHHARYLLQELGLSSEKKEVFSVDDTPTLYELLEAIREPVGRELSKEEKDDKTLQETFTRKELDTVIAILETTRGIDLDRGRHLKERAISIVKDRFDESMIALMPKPIKVEHWRRFMDE